MTLRTTSATRRSVVSRSSEVANTSATSSRRDSTGIPGFEAAEPMTGTGNDSSRILALPLHQNRRGAEQLWNVSYGMRLAPLFSRDDTNVGEVTVFFRIVEPVANHKFVGNLKSYVISLKG